MSDEQSLTYLLADQLLAGNSITKQKVMKPLDQYLASCREPTVWEVGNQTLYDLCEKYPTHTDSSQIVAKTWLIGRTYSVALERRKGASESNEVYYREKIPNVFKDSSLDTWLSTLPEDKGL